MNIDKPPTTIYVLAQRWAEDPLALSTAEFEPLRAWVREAMRAWDRESMQSLSLARPVGRLFFAWRISWSLEISLFEAQSLADRANWPMSVRKSL